MKKKIVLMKNVKHNYTWISEFSEDKYVGTEDIKISKVVEVDLPELENETMVKEEVAIIDKQITKVNADAQAALTALEGRKQELMAICHDK